MLSYLSDSSFLLTYCLCYIISSSVTTRSSNLIFQLLYLLSLHPISTLQPVRKLPKNRSDTCFPDRKSGSSSHCPHDRFQTLLHTHKITPLQSDPCLPLQNHLLPPLLKILILATPNHFISPMSHLFSRPSVTLHCCPFYLECPFSMCHPPWAFHILGEAFPILTSYVPVLGFPRTPMLTAFLLNCQLPEGKECANC